MDPAKKKRRNIMILIILLLAITGVVLFVIFVIPIMNEHKVGTGAVIAAILAVVAGFFTKKRSKANKESRTSEESNTNKESRTSEKSRTSNNKTDEMEFINARVDIVIDGDTAMFKYENVDDHIKGRFIGLNCPEDTKTKEPFGKDATEFVKKELLKKEVFIEYDEVREDQHGRALIYIWLEKPNSINKEELSKKLFNAILVKEGYARFFNDKNDKKYHKYLREFEQEAKDSKKGMWALDVYEKERVSKKIWINKD